MLRVRDIMTENVITFDPELSIREAMDILVARRVSGAPVVAGGEVIGVVTATDLLQFAAALPGVPTERTAAPEFFGDISGDEDEEATLRDEGEDDEPSALYFTELWDDSGASAVDRMATPATAEWNVLEEHTVSEAMTSAPVCSLTPDALVTVAADYMRQEKIHRVLVMVGKKLVGVVSSSDITAAVADGKLTSHTFVFDREPGYNTRRWGRRTR